MTEAFDLLFFSIRGRRCAIDVGAVREILSAPSVTPVPLVPSVIRGAMSFHGLPVSVLDLGFELLPGSLEAMAATTRAVHDYALIIEAHLPDEGPFVRAALSVERVTRVVSVPTGLIRPSAGHPVFVSASVVDTEGPALLIDAPLALEFAMKSIRQGRQAA